MQAGGGSRSVKRLGPTRWLRCREGRLELVDKHGHGHCGLATGVCLLLGRLRDNARELPVAARVSAL